MANGDYLPDGEAQFLIWFNNFIVQCEKYEAELGLDAPTLGELNTLNSTYNTKLTASATAKELLKSSTADKLVARKAAASKVRSYANQWKADPTLTPAILNALGIVATSTSGPVTMVTGLNVNGCGDGVNKLTWNRNGNAPGTSFIIESRVEGTATWAFTASTTKTSFNHTNQIPGLQIWYRIISTRAGVNAGPCPAVTVYGNPGDTELRIAA
jgi:hypothetical protein